MTRERTIVFAAKRDRLQLAPLLAMLVGLGILIYRFWWNTSALHAPFFALATCGIGAAAIQILVATITTSRHCRKVVIIVDVVVITITLATIFFGEYVACDLLKIPATSYAWKPGSQINTVATILTSVVVAFLMFWERREKGQK